MTTDVILVRHGQTDWNRDRRFQGHIDIGLNERGRTEAQQLALRLARAPISAIYSSDLARARDTAQPSAQLLGKVVQQTRRLRERSFGIFEGLTISEIQRAYPNEYQRWAERDPHYAIPGGSSLVEDRLRVLSVLHDLAEDHSGQTILIVTHGGALDLVYRAATGQPLNGVRTCEIPNAAINELRVDDHAIHIVGWADTTHLEERVAV
jgi:2,3-bisphosphoglycerate-dependent phosphoglycerate mutase